MNCHQKGREKFAFSPYFLICIKEERVMLSVLSVGFFSGTLSDSLVCLPDQPDCSSVGREYRI